MNGEGGEQNSERFAAGDHQLTAGGEGRGGTWAAQRDGQNSKRFAAGSQQLAAGGEGLGRGGRSLG